MRAVVDHPGLFIDANKEGVRQQMLQPVGPAFAGCIVMRYDAGAFDEPQAFNNLLSERIIIIFAQHHGAGTAARDNRPGLVGGKHGLPGGTSRQSLSQVMRKPA